MTTPEPQPPLGELKCRGTCLVGMSELVVTVRSFGMMARRAATEGLPPLETLFELAPPLLLAPLPHARETTVARLLNALADPAVARKIVEVRIGDVFFNAHVVLDALRVGDVRRGDPARRGARGQERWVAGIQPASHGGQVNMRKHFVTFFSPGTLFHERTTRDVARWDPTLAAPMAEGIVERYDARPHFFVFSTRERADADLDSRETAKSGRFFLGGRVESYDDVALRGDPKEHILRGNMRHNGWWYVVVSERVWRAVQPFEVDDVVVDAAGRIVERGDAPERVAYRAEQTAALDAEYARSREREEVADDLGEEPTSQ